MVEAKVNLGEHSIADFGNPLDISCCLVILYVIVE